MFRLFSRRERIQLLALTPALVVTGLLEVVGLAAIAPFLRLLTDPESIEGQGLVARLFRASPFTTKESFFIAIGLGVFLVLLIGNAVQAGTTFLLLRFSWLRNHSLSLRLLETYLSRPYEFFVMNNSAELSKNILAEVNATITGIVTQGLFLVSRSVVVAFILAALIAMDPVLAIVAGGTLGGLYGALYGAIRRRVVRQGVARTRAQAERYKLAAEILGAVKESKILGVERQLIRTYREPSLAYSKAMTSWFSLGQIPAYAFEVIAFGGIISMAAFALGRGETTTELAPLLGVYAFGAYRLLPSLQKIFAAVTSIRFNAGALDTVEEGLREAAEVSRPARHIDPLGLTQSMELRGVAYKYPSTDVEVVHNLDLTISRGEWIAVVGPTGAGKSTLADILLGLLEPSTGSVVVDGVPLAGEQFPAWRRTVAYVPQSIFLADDSIGRNIALGVDEDKIEWERLREAASVAQIREFIEHSLAEGYQTRIGERGIRLSGGQRQRIGIARAIYSNRPFLVLDEATNALDTKTEDEFFQAIRKHQSDRTVVSIAHRHSTTKSFDRVVLLIGGVIKQIGTPADLIESRGQFAAVHAETRND